jgi:hypothetical protein
MCKVPFIRLLFAALLAFSVGAGALAQVVAPDRSSRPRIVDTKLDEAERIRLRKEWFFSSRRAGASSVEELAALRAAAVQATRNAIRAQRARRSAGLDETQNFWVAKGPSPSTFGGWTFGNVSGRVSSLAADWASGTLYVGTASGGLWSSENDGLSWTALFDAAGTLTIGTVAVDPNDPGVIWAGTGENNQGCESYFGIGLLRSGDGGLTWEPRNGTGGQTLDDLSSFANVVIDPRDSAHLVTGGRIRGCTSGSSSNGGIYTSTDAGLTWTLRLADTAVYEIAQDPIVPDTYWAATGAGVYKSVNNAETWVLQTSSGLPSGSTGRTELAVSPSDSNVVYVLFQSPNELWRTMDGGATWSRRASGSDACDGQCSYNMVLRVHRTNPDIVIRGTIRIWRSEDGGVTWTDLSNGWGSSQKVHQDMHVLVMDPDDPNVFYAGGDGGLWKTADLGETFTNKNGNLNITQFYAVGVDAMDPGTVCGGAQDNSSLARTVSDVWDLQTVTGDGFVCHFDPLDPSYAYITSYPSGGYPSVYRSTSGVLGGFSRITGAGSGIIAGDRINWVTPYLLDPLQPERLYLGTHRVYRSDDHGSNWVQVGPTDLTGGSGSLRALEINRIHTDVLYSGSESGRVWRSVDAGSNWTDISSGLPSRAVTDVASDPDDPDRALAVVGGFNTAHLWEWNAGVGWVERGLDLPNVPANTVLMLTGTDVMVGTDTGVFRSADGGNTFEPYMNGLPEGLVVTDLKYNPTQSVVTAGTYGRGAWQVQVETFGPIVLYDAVELPMAEIDGDGDGNVEPGETWAVRPILRNAGSETALSVQARLASSHPGIRILDADPRSFGDIAPGTTGISTAFEFTADPGFPCGTTAEFDVVDIVSANPPGSFPDAIAAFRVSVDNGVPEPIYTVLLDETFDSGSAPDWTHRAVDPNLSGCNKAPKDEWNLATKDAARGPSYHCGRGPGNTYSVLNYAWLHHGGTDSTGGAGLSIPATAQVATLTVEHWYETVVQGDGGKVVVDGVADGEDTYTTLVPVGGYPSGNIAFAGCNGLEGTPAFHGSSGGWITSTFDLTAYRGGTVWLAFVFGSDDRRQNDGEGWYIDRVRLEIEEPGLHVCDVVRWPGSIPSGSLRLDKAGAGDLQATWSDSCNGGDVPGQTYGVHAGSLSVLHGSGQYDHAPVSGSCDRISPSLFTPGPGDEYYLVAPVQDGREGGLGRDSTGLERPQGAGSCGAPRAESCP